MTINVDVLNLRAQIAAARQAVTDAAAQAVAALSSATAAQTARTGAEAARDEAQALVLSDLGTTDGQTAALIDNPLSQTASALSASTVQPRARDASVDVAPLPFVNVRDFGAVGDGVTDDLPAFEACATALGANGGHISIPPGHYLLSDSWVIDTAWVIVTADPNALIDAPNLASAVGGAISFIGGGTVLGTATTPQQEYAEWNGGRIETPLAGSNENAIGFVRYKQARCRNLTVPECGRKAVTAQYGVDHILFENIDVGTAGNDAITVEFACDFVKVANVRVASARRGVYVLDATTTLIDRLLVDDCTDRAIYVQNGTSATVRNPTIRGAGVHGIEFNGVAGRVVVEDFDISGTVAGGIYSQAGTGTLSFGRGTVDSPGTFGVSVAGASMKKVKLDDVFVTGVAVGQDQFVFNGLTVRPLMVECSSVGTVHRYSVNSLSMSGKEALVVGCDLSTGASGKYGGWKPKLESVTSALSAISTKDFASIPAHSSAELTFTVAGAVLGDHVIAQPMAAGLEAGLVWSAYVSAADTVTLRLANVTTAAIDPASRQWKVTVLTPA